MGYDQRPGSGEYLEYYDRYIARVPAGDIVAILATQLDDTLALLRDISEAKSLHAYAPGKWTIKEVIGHVIDAERIFCYRALRFARADQTPLAGFDENAYVPAGSFNERPLASLIAELASVRRATISFFAGLPPEAWARGGPANGNFISVRALAWIAAGHEIHHRDILATRYLAASIPV